MGLQITKTSRGYRIKDSVSDEYIHDKKYLNRNEVKTALIERQLFKFFEEVTYSIQIREITVSYLT